jgi:hypothetical protein
MPDFVPTEHLPYFRLDRLVPLILDLDGKGRVTKVAPENPFDTGFARYAGPWMESLAFEPALFQGKKTVSRLPLTLHFQLRTEAPDVFFPLDTSGAIADADLYFEAFRLNGIRLPHLEEFPSYFCDLQLSDTSVALKFVLLRLKLDETGGVVDIEEVRSTFGAYTMSIMSAALWADFSPAIVQDTAVASECFLLVSFFPQINYPTRVWRRSQPDSLSLLDRFRVRVLPDTVGFMVKPLPARASGDVFRLKAGQQLIRDTVNTVLFIDTSGRARMGQFNRAGKEIVSYVRAFVSRLRFFPALDYEGQPHLFSGLVSFVFQGSQEVRVIYHWLSDHDSSSDN